MRALVVGGSGPTGPHVVSGLRERGYEVTILHRGTHELPELADLEHVHADPHFRETLDEALVGRTFDLVVGMYGRLRHVAGAVAGSCDRFIGVSGIAVYAGMLAPDAAWPRGVPVLADEEAASIVEADDLDPALRFSHSVHVAERTVLDLHAAAAFSATIFRYPRIYGARQVYPSEWSVIRRVLDGRPFIILPDGGLTIETRCAARNAAHFLLCAVDRPDAATGEIFNVADSETYSLRQWTQLTSSFAGRELEIVSLPFELAGPGRDLFALAFDDHSLFSADKAKRLLGYADAIPVQRALEETVAWYVEHPPDDGVLERMKDRFDYRREDELLARYLHLTAALRAEQEPTRTAAHSYPHPKRPGAKRDHRGR